MEDDLSRTNLEVNVITFFSTGFLAKDFKLSEKMYLSDLFNLFSNRMRLFKDCLSTYQENCFISEDGLSLTSEIYDTFKFFLNCLFDKNDIQFDIVNTGCVKSIIFNLGENSIIFSDNFKR